MKNDERKAALDALTALGQLLTATPGIGMMAIISTPIDTVKAMLLAIGHDMEETEPAEGVDLLIKAALQRARELN